MFLLDFVVVVDEFELESPEDLDHLADDEWPEGGETFRPHSNEQDPKSEEDTRNQGRGHCFV
jgi:hypothetical protein